jgi:hypothetical protein
VRRSFFCALARGLALSSLLWLAFGTSAPVAGQTPTTKPLTPANMVSPKLLVERIDTNCVVFKSAIKTVKPTDVIAEKKTWRLASADEASTARAHLTAYTLAEVWKQAGNYNWIRSYTVGSGGGHHAVQMCFRNDGTLARVRQGATIPALDASGSSVAYYNTDGSVIRKSATFSVNDPLIARRVRDLPYFNVLP